MSMIRILPCALLLGLALAGCSDSSSLQVTEPEVPPEATQPELAVDFTTFVKTQIDDTPDERAPVSINNKEFSFNDQNNEQAFDSLF